MISHSTKIRVRYAETDRMGYVYYGNYPTYFEVGRVEWLRALGLSYKELEDSGTMLPVLNLNVKYIRPARYDELLTLITRVEKWPGTRLEFHHEVLGPTGERLTLATVELVFAHTDTGRPKNAPDSVLNAMRPYFPEDGSTE